MVVVGWFWVMVVVVVVVLVLVWKWFGGFWLFGVLVVVVVGMCWRSCSRSFNVEDTEFASPQSLIPGWPPGVAKR